MHYYLTYIRGKFFLLEMISGSSPYDDLEKSYLSANAREGKQPPNGQREGKMNFILFFGLNFLYKE